MRVVFENVGRDVYLDEVYYLMMGMCRGGTRGMVRDSSRLLLEN